MKLHSSWTRSSSWDSGNARGPINVLLPHVFNEHPRLLKALRIVAAQFHPLGHLSVELRFDKRHDSTPFKRSPSMSPEMSAL